MCFQHLSFIRSLNTIPRQFYLKSWKRCHCRWLVLCTATSSLAKQTSRHRTRPDPSPEIHNIWYIWQNKLKTWSTNNQDDLMVAITLKTKIIWGDWIHSLSLILQLNFEVTEVEMKIFPLFMDERDLFEVSANALNRDVHAQNCGEQWYPFHF